MVTENVTNKTNMHVNNLLCSRTVQTLHAFAVLAAFANVVCREAMGDIIMNESVKNAVLLCWWICCGYYNLCPITQETSGSQRIFQI